MTYCSRQTKRSSRFVLALLFVLFASVDVAASMQRVEYILDSIAEKDGDVIRLLGGSQWVLSSSTFGFAIDEIIIVLYESNREKTKARLALAYVDGTETVATHVNGRYEFQTGYLSTVVEAWGNGAVLKLADGSLLSIPEYDRYYTGWWFPPYKILLTMNKMYLWNLKEGKRVWVNPK